MENNKKFIEESIKEIIKNDLKKLIKETVKESIMEIIQENIHLVNLLENEEVKNQIVNTFSNSIKCNHHGANWQSYYRAAEDKETPVCL